MTCPLLEPPALGSQAAASADQPDLVLFSLLELGGRGSLTSTYDPRCKAGWLTTDRSEWGMTPGAKRPAGPTRVRLDGWLPKSVAQTRSIHLPWKLGRKAGPWAPLQSRLMEAVSPGDPDAYVKV